MSKDTKRAQHTPGPWRLELGRSGGHEVRMGSALTSGSCEVQHVIEYDHDLHPGGEQWEEADANARLIAAAPDMLALLIESRGWTGRGWERRRDEVLARIAGKEV